MMGLLSLDVLDHSSLLRGCDGKSTITALPSETAAHLFLHPFAGAGLHLLDRIGQSHSAGESKESVDVITRAADLQGHMPHPVQNGSEVGMESRSHGGRDHQLAILRAEDRMNKNLGQ